MLNSPDIIHHLEESPRWVLVGFGERTVAVLITHETVLVFLTDDIGLSLPVSRPMAEVNTHQKAAIPNPQPTPKRQRICEPETHSSGGTPIYPDWRIPFTQCSVSPGTPLPDPACDSQQDPTTGLAVVIAQRPPCRTSPRPLAKKPVGPPPSLLRPSQTTTALTLPDQIESWWK